MTQPNLQQTMTLPLPLTRFRVRNFKAISDVSFEIKPLNLILGSNSAGKSSILQALVLCSQNFYRGSTYSFDLNNQHLTLGPFGDLLRRGTKPGDNLAIELEFCREISDGTQHKYVTKVTLDSRRRNLSKSSVPVSKFQISEEVASKKAELNVVLRNGDPSAVASISGTYFARQPFVQRGRLENRTEMIRDITPQRINGVFTPSLGDRFLPVPFLDRSIFLIHELRQGLIERFVLDSRAQKGKSVRLGQNFQEARANFPEIMKALRSRSKVSEGSVIALNDWFDKLELSQTSQVERLTELMKSDLEDFDRAEVFKGLKDVDPSDFAKFLRDKSAKHPVLRRKIPQILILSGYDQRESYESAVRFANRQFLTLTDKLQYLGPLRAHSLTEQKNEASPHAWTPLGARGELLGYQLGTGGFSKNASFPVPRKYGKKVKFATEVLSLQEALALWTQWFELGDNLKTMDEGVWGSYLELDEEKFHRKGTGISQVLPVIAICLLASRNSLTLIEQPELHLHPSMQQKLGTFFSEISKTGRRLLIETHSEYILTRIRREIATGALDNKDVSVTFVSSKRGKDGQTKSQYDQIEISETGTIAKWPQAFYDFTADDKIVIFEATMDAK